ncbi:hypothetical protein VPH35_094222 [Triticum aestivum]
MEMTHSGATAGQLFCWNHVGEKLEPCRRKAASSVAGDGDGRLQCCNWLAKSWNYVGQKLEPWRQNVSSSVVGDEDGSLRCCNRLGFFLLEPCRRKAGTTLMKSCNQHCR